MKSNEEKNAFLKKHRDLISQMNPVLTVSELRGHIALLNDYATQFLVLFPDSDFPHTSELKKKLELSLIEADQKLGEPISVSEQALAAYNHDEDLYGDSDDSNCEHPKSLMCIFVSVKNDLLSLIRYTQHNRDLRELAQEIRESKKAFLDTQQKNYFNNLQELPNLNSSTDDESTVTGLTC